MGIFTKKPKFSSFQIIIGGFATAILLGGLLLSLPVSSAEGRFTPLSEGLFTATSAVCVTGLLVHDTATYWSLFGKIIILLLIQMGGMGVVTVAVSLFLFSGKRITLTQRSLMQESISASQVGGIIRLTRFILRCMVVMELSGALLLAPVFCRDFGIIRGLGYALFHSISAFCNAGFDLMGIREQYSSLVSYSGSAWVNLVIMAMIILGGIGFHTWADIAAHRLHFRQYKLQTKIILTATAVLILLPAVYFYFGEFGALQGKDRMLASVFQAVTPRTAGFNTVDEASLTDTGKMLTIVLMLIGGAPGSTAGGMKITTAAVMLASAAAVFHQRETADLFHRRLDVEIVRKASAIFLMYNVLFIGAAMMISRLEGVPLLTCLFETASAIGTVGLSLGLTPALGLCSRWILIILMFFGRVGGLTIIFAAFTQKGASSRFPKEEVAVG